MTRDEARRHARHEQHERELNAYIRRIVDEAPPLTPEQLARVAALLRPTLPLRQHHTDEDNT